MGIEGMDSLKPGAQPASDTPDDSGLQTPLPDQEVEVNDPNDLAPDADEPGDTQLDPELEGTETPDDQVGKDAVDEKPSDG